ncbi:MAG TPA: sulfite exporter TauE/SafE family protein [Alphaproteobacteria bacterium]|nr:sulfite exporter TauE/SafE family protein [Alphaproteobacteria bacterium]
MIELHVSQIAIALASGVVIGFLLALFGGGGSVLAAPLMIYAVGVKDTHIAIGTAAAAVAASALISLIGHWREHKVKWPCATVFATMGLLGSIAGSTVAKATDGRHLLFLFSLAMAAIALSMLRKPKFEGNPSVRITGKIMVRLAPMGVVVGFVAGFFGIGGGFLIVPGLMLASGMTLANAAASSLVSVALFAATTSGNYALSGLVDWRLVLCLVAGGVIGIAPGLWTATRLVNRVRLARTLFASLVLVVAAYIAYRSLIG